MRDCCAFCRPMNFLVVARGLLDVRVEVLMPAMPPDVRRYTVHRRRGDSQTSLESVVPPRARPASTRTIADRVPITELMSRELVCARGDLEISKVVWLMAHRQLGCVPVVDDRRHPIGVITKFDLIEHLDAAMQSIGNGSPMPADLTPRDAEEVMMPIALVLEEHATVAHAAAMMALEDTHHVLVVRASGELLGVVSSKDIVKWLVANDDLTPATHASPWPSTDSSS